MNRLSVSERARILGMLTEGNSMRAASRMADESINTVTKLLVDVGSACATYQHEMLRNLPCQRPTFPMSRLGLQARPRRSIGMLTEATASAPSPPWRSEHQTP
jgi:hypothetical protein